MNKNLLTGVSFLGLAAVLPGHALAQAAPPAASSAGPAAQSQAAPQGDGMSLSEIIVTATRRDSNLQSTPIAVSALDSSTIKNAAPRDLGDLATFVPNFSAAKITAFNAASFALRGVSVNNIIVYYEAPVGVLVDDFVVSSVQTQLLDTFDIAQVEVLRGPQGTLFGKNTTGGAVTVRTRRPNLDHLGVEVRGSYGSFNTFGLQGSADVPIIAGQLGLRVVGSYQKSDGYAKNGYCYGPITPFGPTKFAGVSGCGNGAAVGGTDAFAGRAKLLWEPTSGTSVLLQYEMLRDNSPPAASVEDTPNSANFLFSSLGVGGARTNTGDPLDRHGAPSRDDVYLKTSTTHVNVDGFYLNANIDVGIGTITNVTGYRDQRSQIGAGSGQGAIKAADGETLSLFDYNREDNRRTFQQELRFASSFAGPFNFVAGLFHQNEKIDFCVAQVVGFLDLTGGTTPYGTWNQNPFILCSNQRAKSTALFTEGTYAFNDKLKLTGGFRYSWEDKVWRGRQQSFVQDITGRPTATWRDQALMDLGDFARFPTGVVTNSQEVKKPTWRVSLSYQFNNDLFGYATYSRGFKAGGFNDQIGSFGVFGSNLAAFQQAANPTRPETADSYEAGFKSEFLDRKLRFNLTGFYVKYSDLQKQIVVPLVANGQSFQVSSFFNAASATVKGIEAEVTAIPVQGLTLRANLGYQDAKYGKYVTPIPAGYDLATAPLDRAPAWQWAADASYKMPVGDVGNVTIGGNVAYTGRNLYSQSITSPAENTFLDARTLFNASIGFTSTDDRYSLRVVGRNLTDARYKVGSLVVGGLWTFSNYGAPRSVMVEGGVKF